MSYGPRCYPESFRARSNIGNRFVFVHGGLDRAPLLSRWGAGQVAGEHEGDSRQLGDVAKQFLRYLETFTRASPGEFRVGDDHALVSLL